MDEAQIYESGGVDGVLHVRLTRMQLKLSMALFFTAIPMVGLYYSAFDPWNENCATGATSSPSDGEEGGDGGGGDDVSGFGRFTLANALCAIKDNPDDTWRLWILVGVVWLQSLFSLHFIDKYHLNVLRYSLEAAKTTAPLHHYALVVTDIPPEASRQDVHNWFARVAGADALLSVHHVYRYSELPTALAAEAKRSLTALSGAPATDAAPVNPTPTGAPAASGAGTESSSPAPSSVVTRGPRGYRPMRMKSVRSIRAEARRRAAQYKQLAVGAGGGLRQRVDNYARALKTLADSEWDRDSGVDGTDADTGEGEGEGAELTMASSSQAPGPGEAGPSTTRPATGPSKVLDVARKRSRAMDGARQKALLKASAWTARLRHRLASSLPSLQDRLAQTSKALQQAHKARARVLAALREHPPTGADGAPFMDALPPAPANAAAGAPATSNWATPMAMANNLVGAIGNVPIFGAVVHVTAPVVARQKVEEGGMPISSAAIVVVDALARASAVCQAPVVVTGTPGISPGDQWNIHPAPEPREIRWQALEELRPVQARRSDKTAGMLAKALVLLFWTLIVSGIQYAVIWILNRVAELPVREVNTLANIIAGIVPVSLQNILFVVMANVLRLVNNLSGSHWTLSSLDQSVLVDYGIFLRIVAFLVPIFSRSIFDSLTEISEQPSAIFELMSKNVPENAYYFMAYAFLRTAACAVEMTRLPQVAMAMLKLVRAKTPHAREDAMVTPPPKLAEMTGWNGYVLLVNMAYAPVAPLTAFVCLFYAAVALAAGRHEYGVASVPRYDSMGRLAVSAANQAFMSAGIAMIIHISLLALSGASGATLQVYATLPLPLLFIGYGNRMRRRQRLSIHGVARGRLPLADAAEVDDRRPREEVVHKHAVFSDDVRGWTAPCAPARGAAGAAFTEGDPAGSELPPGPDELGQAEAGGQGAAPGGYGEEYQVRLHKWLNRYNRASATAY